MSQNVSFVLRRCFQSIFVSRRFRTIFALSSGQTRAAIAVIRISGSKASTVLQNMTPWRPSKARPGYLFLTSIRHPLNQELLDKAMAVWMPGPKTFTGEDCCELHVHGGPSVVSDILEALSHVDDCFPAEPGEFTKRAFYNGKFDLTGVEGLADLLRAETSAQRKLALRQAGGELRRLYGDWRQRLLKCVAHIEAFVDFAEDAQLEETVLADARQQVEVLLTEMRKHLADGRVGERLRDGIRVAIVGEPNVGKSSLLNRICRRPAAIVTPIAGTTRDPLDIALNLNGYPVVLTDTAGLRETEDVVEKEGVRRARQKLREADILLIVLDAACVSTNDFSIRQRIDDIIDETLLAARRAESDEDEEPVKMRIPKTDVESEWTPPEVMVVLNKIDLIGKHDDALAGPIACETKSKPTTFPTSCVNGDGLDHLMETLSDVVKKMCSSSQAAETIPLTQERHRFLVTKAIKALESFLYLCSRGGRDVVLAAESLRQAMHALGKITGQDVTTDEMLDVLFRDFCIGK